MNMHLAYSRARDEAPPRVQAGAYALVFDRRGRVLTVRTGGKTYLPGGRIEPGEGPRAALAREIGEECGWTARIGGRVAAAEQPIFGGAVALQASYWRAALEAPCEPSDLHEMAWLMPEDAETALHRAGDRAALAIALAKANGSPRRAAPEPVPARA